MRGLLIKDFINIKKQLMTFSAFVVLYIVLSLQSGMTEMFQGVIVVLFAMLPITALAYDERTKWDKFMIALPISRRKIVLEKYVFGVIMSIIAGIIGLIFQLIVNVVNRQVFEVESLAVVGAFIAFALFFLAINLPVMFKFGTEKGRFLIIAISVVFIILPGLLSNVKVGPIDDVTIVRGVIGAVIGILVFFVFSAFLSVRIYEKKNF